MAITSPARLEADPDEWQQRVNVPKIEREDTCRSKRDGPECLWLKEPPVKLSAKTKDGKTSKFSSGRESKTHNYAKVGSSMPCFSPPTGPKHLRNVSDLRNKKVLDFEPNDVDNVKIIDGTKELEAQKSGEDWQLKKLLDTKADSSEITSFASAIRFARVNSFPGPPVDASRRHRRPGAKDYPPRWQRRLIRRC
jgi:hypothetical protein